MARRPTTTSSFGVSRRESHDSSGFYARFVTPDISDAEDVHPHKDIDRIFAHSAARMSEVADDSVALVVTSPPYFAGKEYEAALGEGGIPATYKEYVRMLRDVFAECVRTLEPGGRIAVNVANLGRKPYRSLASDVVWVLQDELKLLLRGEIVWQKARGSAGSCAWGSFQKPGNPVLRDVTERVVVASKGRFDRALRPEVRRSRGLPWQASLSREEFMEATTDVWEMAPESAKRVGHPAPFPVELPMRLIDLYTYYDDLVLDPFMGSGTTAVAAVRSGRHFVGYDTDPEYVQRALQRVARERARVEREPVDRAKPLTVPAGAVAGSPGGEFEAALRSGLAADAAVGVLLRESFVSVDEDVKVGGGIAVGFRTVDATGAPWFVDVVGAFSATQSGLKRTDVLWRTLGRAAAVRALHPDVPFVVVTTDVPARGSAAAKALHAVIADAVIADVVVFDRPDDLDRLRSYGRSGRPAPTPR